MHEYSVPCDQGRASTRVTLPQVLKEGKETRAARQSIRRHSARSSWSGRLVYATLGFSHGPAGGPEGSEPSALPVPVALQPFDGLPRLLAQFRIGAAHYAMDADRACVLPHIVYA